MTEEENKAIELIGCLNLNESYIITRKQWNEQDVHKAIDIILNLIEKLKKENEELRQNYDTATTKTEELKKKLCLKQFDVNVVYNDYLEKLREFKRDSIPKDKIREVKQYLEYYLIGNLKYENCQNEFKKILKLLEEEE